jgi:hypothetical protein
MRFYTVQHKAAWQELQRKGQYHTNDKFICEKSFLGAYKWLNDQAKQRIKGWSVERPVWLWVKKPDLRTYRFIKDPESPKYQEFVLIELEIPAKDVLISEFGLWHNILNNRYIPYTAAEDDAFDKKLKKISKEKARKLIRLSWDRCLVDADLKLSNKFEKAYIQPISFQAIIQNIRLDQVVSYQKFTMVNTYKK